MRVGVIDYGVGNHKSVANAFKFLGYDVMLSDDPQALMDAGAKSVAAYITHGVLSGPAVERVTNSVMKSLVITDSIEPTEAVKNCPNIRIVPTAPMFAQAILNIWNGTSVSSLFETDTLVPIYEGMYQRA